MATSKEEKAILEHVRTLHLSPEYSDLKITCGDKTFSAHRAIVCPQSAYFRKACSGSFKEASGHISFPEDEPILIEKVLQFLYTGDYEAPKELTEEPARPSQPPAETSPASGSPTRSTTPTDPESSEAGKPSLFSCTRAYSHLRMYGEGDYFQIDGLKDKAFTYFCALFKDRLNPVSFADMIKELYSTRADYQKPREAAMEIIVADFPNLRRGKDPVLDRELMKLVPDFTFDLCLAILDRPQPRPFSLKPQVSDDSDGEDPDWDSRHLQRARNQNRRSQFASLRRDYFSPVRRGLTVAGEHF